MDIGRTQWGEKNMIENSDFHPLTFSLDILGKKTITSPDPTNNVKTIDSNLHALLI